MILEFEINHRDNGVWLTIKKTQIHTYVLANEDEAAAIIRKEREQTQVTPQEIGDDGKTCQNCGQGNWPYCEGCWDDASNAGLLPPWY